MEDWLSQTARVRPDHPALETRERTLSYAELDAAAAATARKLAALGVHAGDRVATTLSPGAAFAALLHGAPRLGAVLMPLDPRTGPSAGNDARVVVSDPLDGPEAEIGAGPAPDPDAVHSVIRTSGTTGAAKAVELSYANHEASAAASADALGVEPGDRWLCPLPLHHVGGLAVLIRCAIHHTTAVLHEAFDATRVRSTLEGGEVTLASLVPTMLVRLREAGLRSAPGLRAIAVGGGPIPAGLLEWAEDTGIPVVPVYGMTETCSQVVAGSPGRALKGVDLRIAAGGEILVRGAMVARGAADGDGWLHTGDLGRLDGHGRLHVEGRLKELIVTGGENVAALEVEQALQAHPAVADAGVAGVPDADWGEAVTAFVVLDGEVGPEELTAWARGRLAAFKVPKAVHIVGSLPRNSGGKLMRGELARRAAAR